MPAATQDADSAEASTSPKESPKKVPRNRMLCRVTLLDKTCLPAELQKTAKGIDLMARVAEHLNLQEKEYFGLLFDHKGEKYWVDPQKEIKKQLKGNPPNFQLAVKFYEPYPSQLKHDFTRYMMTLQVRDDINCERLPCSFGAQALLGSYVVQSELGDYDPREHKANYLQGMVFSPNQSHELCERIKELHKDNRGLTPEQADIQYLEAARKLTMYGVDAHPARDGNGDEVLVGVSWAGVLEFKDDLQQNRFPWNKVVYLSYKGRNFSIKSRPGELEELTTTMIFKLPTEKAAKRLYKSCVAHHTFFRLSFPDPPPTKTDSLLRTGNKFRYSDRTLFQLRKEGFPVNSTEQPKFKRVSSKNWSKGDQPSTTEIIVVADEEAKKRPLSDKDQDRNGDDKKLRPGQAPLSEEEIMATMTMEEREEYKKRMAEKLGNIKTTKTTTVYYPSRAGEEDIPLEHQPLQASEAGVVDGGNVAYGVSQGASARVMRLDSEEERDRKRKEAEEKERERKRKEEEERRREQEEFEKERERNRERLRELERKEKEKREAAERAVYAARQPPSETLGMRMSTATPRKGEEPEFLEFSFATPVSSGETIKRAQMRSAETESYKGRVMRVDETATPDQTRIAPEVASRTLTWSSAPRPDTYTRGHSTLPSRGKDARLHTDEVDRRKSADNLDSGEDRDKRRHTGGGVPLITRDELVRQYSPATDSAHHERGTAPREIKRSLRDDLDLEHEQGERGFVKENVNRYSGGQDLDSVVPVTEVHTKTVTIKADEDPQVYRQRTPPEVQTTSYTINSVGKPLRREVTEEVRSVEATQAQATPESGGTTLRPSRGATEIPSVPTQRVVYDPSAQPLQPVSSDNQDGVVITRTVTIDGNQQLEPIKSETITHSSVPTEIITKTITIEGDGQPLTAQELKEIMAQQATASSSEVITTTYTTTRRTQTVEKTIGETVNLVDEKGNVIATGDPDTDAAIAEAIRQAREADPNVKVTEVVITRNDESSI